MLIKPSNKGYAGSKALLLGLLLPLCLTPPAFAGEEERLARVPGLLPQAKDLLRDTLLTAADLVPHPPLWEWTHPLTHPDQEKVPIVAQSPVPAAPTAAAEDAGSLSEVTVTATRRPTRARDSTVTTYTIRKEDFQAQGAVTVTDALQLVPAFGGLSALGGQDTTQGTTTGLQFLRGFDDKRFLLLRDGIPIRTPLYGRSQIALIPVDDLERIEVVTGGGSTLRYGAGAVGGVVNLITETPKGSPKLTLEYQVGSYGFSRYAAKYGGGDETFSYNLLFNSTVAFNNYPYSLTTANTAQFYGPTSNINSTKPPIAGFSNYPGGPGLPAGEFGADNSYYASGLNTPRDPDNNGPIDLFGLFKPTVGPPTTIHGIWDSSYNAGDSYAAKLVFKPDVANQITLRLNQRNNNFDASSPGFAAESFCFGGPLTPGTPANQGTLNGQRFLPVDRNGNDLPCDVEPFIPLTPSAALAFPFNFNSTLNGSRTFPTGNSLGAEPSTANAFYFLRRNQSQTETSLTWNYDLTQSTSLNTYVSYFRDLSNLFRPSPFFYNSNLRGLGSGEIGTVEAGQSGAPFTDGSRFEVQSVLNTALSPGQILSFGVNFTQERVLQRLDFNEFGIVGFFNPGTSFSTFIDRSVARTSVFAIDDISFGPAWKANVGFRYDYSSQFGSIGTPGVGLRYIPNEVVSLRANWAQVYNAPSIGDLYIVNTGQTGTSSTISNPNLKPETGIIYDFGLDLTPSRNLLLRTTYFNAFLDGYIASVAIVNPGGTIFGGTPFVSQPQNVRGRRSSGIEFTADWQISDQWRLRAVWTNLDTRFYGATDDIGSFSYPYFYGFQDVAIPFNNVVFAATYANAGLSATLLGRYASGFRRFAAAPNVTTAPFLNLDLNVAIPLTPFFTLTGSVFNLTDTQYEYLDGNPAPGTTFRIGGRLEWR